MIIVRIWEGLGNQLFQYAYARSLKEQGRDVCLDICKSFNEYMQSPCVNRPYLLDKFNITIPVACQSDLSNYSYLNMTTDRDNQIFELAQGGNFEYKFVNHANATYYEDAKELSGNAYIKGWFQDKRYFEDIRFILEKELSLKQEINVEKAIVDSYQDLNAVAVHIRRTDYGVWHNILPYHYYRKSLKEMYKMFNVSKVVVFSDDYLWVKDNLYLGDNVIYIDELETLNDYEQLVLMSRYQNIITANSTFSWWAAWLNGSTNKRIIQPRSYLHENIGLAQKGAIYL